MPYYLKTEIYINTIKIECDCVYDLSEKDDGKLQLTLVSDTRHSLVQINGSDLTHILTHPIREFIKLKNNETIRT